MGVTVQQINIEFKYIEDCQPCYIQKLELIKLIQVILEDKININVNFIKCIKKDLEDFYPKLKIDIIRNKDKSKSLLYEGLKSNVVLYTDLYFELDNLSM